MTTIRAVLLTSVSHLTLVLNSSTNILIYCWKVILLLLLRITITKLMLQDMKFRRVLLKLMRLHISQRPTTPDTQPDTLRSKQYFVESHCTLLLET